MDIIKLDFIITGTETGTGHELDTGNLYLIVGTTRIFEWPVLSGGWGKGPLPIGNYLLNSIRKLPITPENKSFQREGLPWVATLSPQFVTNRTDLCIHPDGGIRGTLGCVGIGHLDMVFYQLIGYLLKTVKTIPLSVIQK